MANLKFHFLFIKILFVLFISNSSLAQSTSFNYPQIDMDSVTINDDAGERLLFYTIYGATQDENMFNRIFNTGLLTYNGLLDPVKRQEYYISVIRRLVIQERFIDFDLLENGYELQVPTQAEIDELQIKLQSYLEGGVAVTDFVNSILLAGDVVPGYLERLTYIDNVPISKFEHFGAAVSGLSILLDGVQIVQTIDHFFATRSLMLGLEMDLANERLAYLENHLNLDDSVLNGAIAAVRNEINTIDDNFWNAWYSSYLQNRDEVASAFFSGAKITNTLMGLAGSSLAGYVGAAFFSFDTWMMTRAHRDKLREATIAATIFHGLEGENYLPNDLYLRSYALKIHLRDRRESVDNWATWTLSWFSGGWEELLNYYQQSYSDYIVSLYDYRLEILNNTLKPLTVEFDSNSKSGQIPLTVRFQDLSGPLNRIQSWKWDLTGNGIIDSYEQNPSYTYDVPGTYSVSLSVSDGTQEVTETKVDFITVAEEEIENPNLSISTKGPYIVGETIQVRVHTDPATAGLKFNFSLSPQNGTINALNQGYTNHFGIANADFSPTASGSYIITASNNQLGDISETINVSDELRPVFETQYVSGDSNESVYRLNFEYQGFSWNNDEFKLETDNGVFISSGSNTFEGIITDQNDLRANLKIFESKETQITLSHNGNKYDYTFIPQIAVNDEITYFKSFNFVRLFDFDWVTADNTILIGNDDRIRKFNTLTWNEEQNVVIADNYVDAIATNRDGTKLIYADNDRLHKADPVTLNRISSSSEFRTDDTMILSWSWDDSKITAIDYSDHFTLNASTLGTLRNFSNSGIEEVDVDYRNSSNHYAVGREDDTVDEYSIINSSTFSEITSFSSAYNSGSDNSVSYSPNGNYLAGSSEHVGLSIYNASNNYSVVTDISDNYTRVHRVRWNPNPDHNVIALAVTTSDGDWIYFYNADTYKRILRSPLNITPNHVDLKWSKDGTVLGIAKNDQLYLYAPFNQLSPILSVNVPEEVNEKEMVVSGMIENFSEYASVSFELNGNILNEIDLTTSGDFSLSIELKEGVNDLKIISEDRFLNTSEEVFSIDYVPQNKISGYVLDENEDPLAGVLVSIRGESQQSTTNTDDSGNYTFTAESNLDYEISASKQGYTITPELISILNLDSNYEANFQAEKITHSISGNILDENEQPGEGIGVKLIASENEQTVNTDNKGYFIFENLQPNESYTIEPFGENISFTPTRKSINSLTQDWDIDFEYQKNSIAFVGNINPITLRAGDTRNQEADTWTYEDIRNLFNGGVEPITYSHESSHNEWVETELQENMLRITAKRGNVELNAATISITATDSDGDSASGQFDVTVSPAFGDVSADTRVNSFDASQVLRKAVELIEFNALQDDIADINRDSRVNSYDASLILRYAVELIDEIPFNSGTSTAVVMASASTTSMSGTETADGRLIWGDPNQEQSTTSIPIHVESSGTIYSVDFSGSYDASVGAITDIIYKDLPDGWVAEDRVDEDEGRIYIAMAGSRPFEGDHIASLEFELLSPYESLPLSGNGTINTTGFSMDQLSVREIPDEFALNRNYPNPFNPSTTISYQLPANSDVRLEVYNITGQRVLTLVDEAMDAGMHTHRFDMSAFSSGVYFIRMQATSETAAFQDVNKMTLIK